MSNVFTASNGVSVTPIDSNVIVGESVVLFKGELDALREYFEDIPKPESPHPLSDANVGEVWLIEDDVAKIAVSVLGNVYAAFTTNSQRTASRIDVLVQSVSPSRVERIYPAPDSVAE